MRKKRLKLHPANDMVNSTVTKTLARVRQLFEQTGHLAPMLIYFKGGKEYSLPMSYPCILKIGGLMNQSPEKADEVMEKAGPVFGFFFMDMARRAENPKYAESDAVHCIENIEMLLRSLSPEVFVVVAPTRRLKIESLEDRMLAAVLGPMTPGAEDVLMVMGRSRIRALSVSVPIRPKKNGGVHYGRLEVADTLLGQSVPHLFCSIYALNLN